MENKTEELIAKIKQVKENRVKAIEKAKMREKRMYDNYQAEFTKLGERINNLMTLGRTLLELGMPIGEKYYDHGFYFDRLKTDGIHHNIGFVVTHGILEGIGIEGGGCCGRDLCVGVDGIIIKGMPLRYCDGSYSEGEHRKMKRLLDGFCEFERNVVNYIENLQ